MFRYIKGYQKEDNQKLFSIATKTRSQNNWHNFQPHRFHLNIKIIFLIKSVLMDIVGFPSLEVFKSKLDSPLSREFHCFPVCHQALGRLYFGLFQLQNFMIRFYDRLDMSKIEYELQY